MTNVEAVFVMQHWSSGGRWTGYETLLDWNTVQSKLAWNVVILLGAGLALSAGAKVKSNLREKALSLETTQ